MNHKLRVLVRVDVEPAQVAIEVTGCVTPSDSETLHHIVQRAGRVAPEADVILDLRGASHLDPEVLLDLRRTAAAGLRTGADPAGISGEDGHVRLALEEPADLPVCLFHIGAEGAVLASLAPDLPSRPGGPLVPAANTGPGQRAEALPDGQMQLNRAGAPAGTGLELPAYFAGTLDPSATVHALSDTALRRLADSLYSDLDTTKPPFGTRTWYEIAAEEIRNRHLSDGACLPGEGAEGRELMPGPA